MLYTNTIPVLANANNGTMNKLLIGVKIFWSLSNVHILLCPDDGIDIANKTPLMVECIPLRWIKYQRHNPAIR
ncbi:hypothetical protein GCM10008921_22070 [Metaclostridioides mangenotii]